MKKKIFCAFLAAVFSFLFTETVIASEPENNIDCEYYSYPMETIEKLEGTIAIYNNTYIIAKGYHGAVIDLSDLDYQKVEIVKNPEAELMGYAFLASELQVNRIPDYAGGYSEVIWDKSESATLKIPSDAKYLYIYYHSNDIIYLPESITFIKDFSEENHTSSFALATWNIGHFSGGGSSSKIKDEQYEKAKAAFCHYIDNCLSADIIGINEYSHKFTPTYSAYPALFSDYSESFIEGVQRRYSCNAIFSKLPIENLQIHEFECNKTATITHTSAIKASDYYYISGELTFNGTKITIVSVHLAFDFNKTPDTICLNEIEELIKTFENEKHIIMMGDWNTQDFSYFNRFTEAGYTLGNDDETLYTYPGRSIDNVIVRGVEIDDFTVYKTSLSDHYGVSCRITVPPIPADINLDGSVDIMDAYTARLIAAKLIKPTEEQLSAGDVDGDGRITAIDANLIRRFSAGIIDSLPV